MKRFIAIIFLLIVVFSLYGCGQTNATSNPQEQEMKEKLDANVHTPIDAAISFRSLKWYETLRNVHKYIEDGNDIDLHYFSLDKGGGDTIASVLYDGKEEITKADLADYKKDYYHFYGVVMRSNSIDVAGYNANTFLYFIYPVIDGEIIENNTYSEFVKAKYFIHLFDDDRTLENAFEDLCKKLTQVYGEPSAKYIDADYIPSTNPYTGSPEIEIAFHSAHAIWKNEDGSALHLLVSSPNVEIYYYAPDAINRIKMSESIVDKADMDEKAADKVDFANNKNGL